MDDFMQDEDVGFPQKGKKLFIPEFILGETAQIAWSNDLETQFFGYVSGYKEAADDVIRSALTKGNAGTLDSYVYPAIFLYRQFLELALKDIYLAYSYDAEDEKIKAIDNCSHDLKKIWEKVKPLIFYGDPDIPAVEEYILEFSEFDRGSFSFRYPIDKKLALIHDKPKCINLRNLAERMNELASYLDAVITGLDAYRSMGSY